jgi:hypothetical protein
LQAAVADDYGKALRFAAGRRTVAFEEALFDGSIVTTEHYERLSIVGSNS